jgi:hypothetical protein
MDTTERKEKIEKILSAINKGEEFDIPKEFILYQKYKSHEILIYDDRGYLIGMFEEEVE